MAGMAQFIIKLEHVNNANSAFIVLLTSQGYESGLIDQVGQGGPGGANASAE